MGAKFSTILDLIKCAVLDSSDMYVYVIEYVACCSISQENNQLVLNVRWLQKQAAKEAKTKKCDH